MRGQLSSGVSVVMCCIKVAAYVHVHMCRHRCIHAGAGTYMQVQVHSCNVHTCRRILAGAYVQVQVRMPDDHGFRNLHSVPCHEVLVHT